MEILLLCGIYAAELFCFHAGLRILFEVHQRDHAKRWMLAGALLPIVIGTLPLTDASGKNMLVTICVIAIMLVVLEGGILEKAVRLVLVFLLMECIAGLFEYPCDQILMLFDGSDLGNIKYLFEMCCTAFLIILISAVKEKIIHSHHTRINSVIYFVIGIIVVSMVFCSAVLKYVSEYIPNRGYMYFCDIINIAILISIFLLVIFVIYIKNTHERMEQLLKTEKLLKESQVNYYKQMLRKEADTRQYRHDMVNHLVYVQDILSRCRIEDAQNYLANMLGGFKKIQNTYYATGNEMIDTILNYFVEMLPDSASIHVKGKCPVTFDMEDTDVCTVFSNIFQNAVEEIKENNVEHAEIIVEAEKGRYFAKYTILNSLSDKIDPSGLDKRGFPISRKSDRKNHGIGMANIKNAAERNEGKFEWFQKDGYFGVTVTLPIK